jgi:hypothetical protein
MFGMITAHGIITSYLGDRYGPLISEALTQEFCPIILSFKIAITFGRSQSALNILSDGISETLKSV